MPFFYNFWTLHKILYRIVYYSFSIRPFFMDLLRFEVRWRTQVRVFSCMQKSVVRHFPRFSSNSAGFEVSLRSTIDAFWFNKVLSALLRVSQPFELPFSWDIAWNCRVALSDELYRNASKILTKISSNQMYLNSHRSSKNIPILTNDISLNSGKIGLLDCVN